MSAVVIDASALVEYLLGTETGTGASTTIEGRGIDLHAPSLCDVELASALRRLIQTRAISLERARQAIRDYADLPVTRHGHLPLLDRMLTLRHNFSAYDAAYVALAERLKAKLLTCDAPLAQSVRAHLPGLDLLAFAGG